MSKGSWRGRRSAVLAACLAGAFAAMAVVLSVSIAATRTSNTTKGTTSGTQATQASAHVSKSAGKTKGTGTGTGLTKSEVIALIKRYSKGATGPQGATGTGGVKGETGAKGETGTKGEKGEKGTNGENGQKGENGAVAGYSNSQPLSGAGEHVEFTNGTEVSPTLILSKALPPGNYLASGKVELGIFSTDSGGEGDVNCALVDTPESGSPALDTSGFFSSTIAYYPAQSAYGAASTVPMEVAIDATSPSLLTISCWVTASYGGVSGSTPGAFAAFADHAHLQAVQTTSNS
jgi:hypothetical protein